MKKNKIIAFIILLIITIILTILNINHYYSYQIVKAINDNNQELFLRNIYKINDVDTRPYPELFAKLAEYTNFSPLQVAAYEGDYYYVEELMKLGANINFQDDSIGYSPLICAIESKGKDKEKIILYLIQNGADLKVVDKANRSLIQHAIDNNIKHLIE